MTIISHHHSVGALQSRGNREIGTWAAMWFTAPGVFESAPVVENVEVAAAAGGNGEHSNSDVSRRPDCKQKASGMLSGGRIKH